MYPTDAPSVTGGGFLAPAIAAPLGLILIITLCCWCCRCCCFSRGDMQQVVVIPSSSSNTIINNTMPSPYIQGYAPMPQGYYPPPDPGYVNQVYAAQHQFHPAPGPPMAPVHHAQPGYESYMDDGQAAPREPTKPPPYSALP